MVVIQDYCIRCGMCVDLCPDMFSFNFEKDRIDVLDSADKPENADRIKQMAADCAVAAIVKQQRFAL